MTDSNTNRSKRHDVNFAGRLERLGQDGSSPTVLDIEIVDLSAGGAAICCDQHIAPQSTWMLRLDPMLYSGFAEAVVVRWCSERDERFRCGVQFISGAALFLQAGIGLESAIDDLGAANKSQPQQLAITPETVPSLAFTEPAFADHMTKIDVYTDSQLVVAGSMIDCQATLGGPLVVGQCLAGGHVVTSNTIQVGTLGQPNRPASLVIGSLPKSNALFDRVPKQLELFQKKIDVAEHEISELRAKEDDLVHADRERIMELEFELPSLQDKHAVLRRKFDELINFYKDKIQIEVKVDEILHEGVVIECHGRKYEIPFQLTGPFCIVSDANNDLTIAFQDQPEQLLAVFLSQHKSEGLIEGKTDAA